MIEEQGIDAVKKHAEETGMLDFIQLAAELFPLENVAIYSPGKYTYSDYRPIKRKAVVALDSGEKR